MTAAPVSSVPHVLTDVPLAIDPDEVVRFHGYKPGGDAAEAATSLAAALGLGETLVTPRAVVGWHAVRARGDDALVLDDAVLTIPEIGRAWGPVTEVAAAVVTIGDAVERRVRALRDGGESAPAAMLDSVGSGAVESLAEYVNDLLCQQGIARGMNTTNRISPGYGTWDLHEQPALLRLVSAETIGVRLDAAGLMTPRKSITLLVGAGPAARVDHYFSQCARCWAEGCARRRVSARRTVRHRCS